MTPADLFASAQQWLFEALIGPAAFRLGLGNLLEDGFVAAGWLLLGLALLRWTAASSRRKSAGRS